MNIFKWAETKCKTLGLIDTKLTAFVGVCVGLLLAIWIPRLLDINIWWIIIVGVLATLKVWYTILLKK